jgi:hypothetical protein
MNRVRISIRRWVILPALLGALVATAAPARASDRTIAHITSIAWEPEAQVGRLVIRLDAPITYRTMASPSSILVDLWRARHVEWRAQTVTHRYVQGVRVNQLTDDLARIRIDLRRPAHYKTYMTSDPSTLTVVIIPPGTATAALPSSVAYSMLRVPTGAGTAGVHILRINPEDRDLEIRPMLAADMVSGAETTSVIATRHDAVAAINGGYFGGQGMPLGMVVINGDLVSTPLPRRSVLAFPQTGPPVIRDFEFSGRVYIRRDLWIPVTAVNSPPEPGGVAVYMPQYGPLTPPVAMAAVVRHDFVEHVPAGRVLIPRDGYVLAATAADAGFLTHLEHGQRLALSLDLNPDLHVIHALGGGPRLVKDGRAFIPFMWEWFSSPLTWRRAARTAVGITAAGKLLLVTVDGGNRQNSGMTLRELGALMVQLGARDAINLDGGGSATMVAGGRVVNSPSDGEERLIASALVVLRRPSTGLAVNTSSTHLAP